MSTEDPSTPPELAMTAAADKPSSKQPSWPERCAVVLIVCGIAICFHRTVTATSAERTLSRAAAALAAGRIDQAEIQAIRVPADDPSSSSALLVAGQAAVMRQASTGAIAYLSRVPQDDTAQSIYASLQLGEQLMTVGRVAEAEKLLRRVLDFDPVNTRAHERLAYLLAMQGRTWAVRPHVFELIRSGAFNGNYLATCSSTEMVISSQSEFNERCLDAVPEDPLPLMRDARLAIKDNENQRADELLRRIVAAHPNVIEAQARLGGLILNRGSTSEFLEWHRRLPELVDGHPEIWHVRGRWAKSRGQQQAAVRCFGEAVKLYPDHRGANYQLSQVLRTLRKPELAESFASRTKLLSNLDFLVESMESANQAEVVRKMTRTLIELGRYWEAAAWFDLVLRADPQLDWAEQGLASLRAQLPSMNSYHAESAGLMAELDLSRFPLPDWNAGDSAGVNVSLAAASTSQIHFADLAEQAGLHFTYENGDDPTSDREYLMQLDGGGIAVLDYDADGWPDLYLTQGGTWPIDTDQQQRYRDRLFRNLGDGKFQDVTADSGLDNIGYSQGVTVGDFNNDGFPDLYVANIGANRLYRNDGDGTFSDVTDASETAGTEWTASCLIADLNGDSLPDVYAVNYLGGDDLFSRVCTKSQAQRCTPSDFPAAQDRLYLNLGDGRFQDVTKQSGIVAVDGKGLGIVAADFDRSRRLSLFVGNDSTPNFFFLNQTPDRSGPPKFLEQGVLTGLAFNDQGLSQACMGIAAGDANGDGQFDMFVTNFYVDSNTLYQQQPDGTFLDVTPQAKLRDPGYNMLGWGTQFLDAELDGFPDLIITNGHVHEPSEPQIPYRMPAQFHRNLGNARFEEMSADSLGPYFGKKLLGRALARIDWNRDGLEDAVISHLHTRVALLTNQTSDVGHFLGVRLRAVTTARDAIGATVRVTAGDRTWTSQLTAGDGYQASNQRQLVFGIGQADRIDELLVRWPSGSERTFHEVPIDTEITLVEATKLLFTLPRN